MLFISFSNITVLVKVSDQMFSRIVGGDILALSLILLIKFLIINSDVG